MFKTFASDMAVLASKAKQRCGDIIDGATGKVVGTVVGTGVSVFEMNNANAAGVDLSTLTTAIDFSTTTTAIMGAAAALMVVYIAFKAAKLVIRAVKGL